MERKAALINQPGAAFSIQEDFAGRRVVLLCSSAYKIHILKSLRSLYEQLQPLAYCWQKWDSNLTFNLYVDIYWA